MAQANSEVDFLWHDFLDTGVGCPLSWGGRVTRAILGRSLAIKGQADPQPVVAFSTSHLEKEKSSLGLQTYDGAGESTLEAGQPACLSAGHRLVKEKSNETVTCQGSCPAGSSGTFSVSPLHSLMVANEFKFSKGSFLFIHFFPPPPRTSWE